MRKKKKKRKTKKKAKKKFLKKRKNKRIQKKRVLKSKRKIKKVKSKKKSKEPSEKIYKTKSEWIKNAYANKSMYEKKYKESLRNNNDFWAKEGKRITWIKPYTKIKDVTYSKTDVSIKWFYDGTLNASANCIDRHLKKNKDKTAIIWVGDDPKFKKNKLQTTAR